MLLRALLFSCHIVQFVVFMDIIIFIFHASLFLEHGYIYYHMLGSNDIRPDIELLCSATLLFIIFGVSMSRHVGTHTVYVIVYVCWFLSFRLYLRRVVCLYVEFWLMLLT